MKVEEVNNRILTFMSKMFGYAAEKMSTFVLSSYVFFIRLYNLTVLSLLTYFIEPLVNPLTIYF